MMKLLLKIFFTFFLLLFTSCGGEKTEVQKENQELANINSMQINLPDSAGKDIFEANCLTCHSSAYIQMQPNFSRKTWEKTVEKMKKNYGAPMDSVSAVKIVNYLMAIKGKK